MRIIAGKFGHRVLNSPINDDIRPTIDRVKEPLFSKIQLSLPGACVLDLFSGTGALGLEALSRGAAKVYFCDSSKVSCDLTKSNLKMVGADCELLNKDYLQALLEFKSRKIHFDIIFIDPPYKLGLGEPAIIKIAEYGLLNKGGIIVYEHAYSKDFTLVLPDKFIITDTRKYGTVELTFIGLK